MSILALCKSLIVFIIIIIIVIVFEEQYHYETLQRILQITYNVTHKSPNVSKDYFEENSGFTILNNE
jgi:cell division protein FtsL